jgi:hypothetical protein
VLGVVEMGWEAGMVVGLKGLLVVYTQRKKSDVRKGMGICERYICMCVFQREERYRMESEVCSEATALPAGRNKKRRCRYIGKEQFARFH